MDEARVLKETQPLTPEQYNGKGTPYGIHDIILAQVRREERGWYKDEPAPLPTFKKPVKEKLLKNIAHGFKFIISQFEELRP